MKNVVLVFVSMFLSVSVSAQSLIKKDVRIVGGSQVVSPAAEAPFILLLDESCGASILNDSWVLTAAHCVQDIYEFPGLATLETVDGIKLGVKKVYIHPKFEVIRISDKEGALNYDFALLELKTKIDFTKTKAKAIKLATPAFEAQGKQDIGVMATVYGYGLTKEKGFEMSPFLNKVDVPIVSEQDATVAQAYHPMAATEAVIFAGYQEGKKDACQGDSGGPLVITDKVTKEKVQVGIVSWGHGCARAFKYGVYSKVSEGFAWIKMVTGLK